jgi:two-component system CheB/CheR fusion protein
MTEKDAKPSLVPHDSTESFFVVGIGASAGGIGPLREFFSHVHEDSGMAYVVILHLSPQHESNLPELLQTRTPIPVTQVTESIRVEANHIYVIPPSKYLVIADGMIRLAEPERPRGGHTSIDLFFRTLADAYGKDSVAILLSGTGADGTIGLGRIKEQGGFVIVQDPAEAEYPDMPRSAIEAGLVDLTLPVAEMPAKLRALHDGARRLQVPEEERERVAAAELDEGALRNALTLLRLRTGNDFSQYRRPTLLRRIARRMQVHEMHDLNAYVQFLREHPEEVSALLRDLLITVTNFFRDKETFEFLETEIVPKLFAGKGPNDQIRVWSAGCATGEEAYSIAILLAEYAARLSEAPKIQVFGTDIDERAIAQARECRYPATIALDVSPARLRQFFVKDGDRYQLTKQIREMVLLAPHNVLRDPPFSKLDFISCRNLLIYLNREMQERVLEILHFALRPNGFLLLGASESADNMPSLFIPIDKKRRIYQRRTSFGTTSASLNAVSGRWQFNMPASESVSHEKPGSAGQLHHQVVEQLAPPSVLINEDYDILHISANAGRYMRISGGEPTRNLLKLVHPALQLDLRSALLEAKSLSGDPAAASRRSRIGVNGESRWVNLTVRQVVTGPSAARGFFLVVFDETTETTPVSLEQAQTPGGELDMLRQLEQELQQTKDQLRITIEQYETSTEELRASNEELQAINEELRSATEELETSKEELQSVNEELSTVNQEYKEKIEEVSRANGDLQNLMASMDIGTIFLDRNLQIRRYTPSAEQLFNITPADVGRPLEHFTHKLYYGSLHQDAERVLRTLHTLEREVKSTDGLWYLARLTPYRTLDDKIDGVVLTFVDITNHKRFEEQLESQTIELKEQAAILNLVPVLVLDSQRRITLWNAACQRVYGYSAEEAIGQIAHNLLSTEFPCGRADIDAQLERSGSWEGELTHVCKDGTRLTVASHWILHRRRPEQPPVILEMDTDITARRLAEEALREADRRKDLFIATLAHELRNPLSAMLNSVELLHHRDRDEHTVSLAATILKRQLKLMIQMVDDLLDIERLTHGRIALKKTRVAVAEVVEAVLENCRPLIDAHTHRLHVSIPKNPVFLEGDPTRLAQILSNLLDNAFKYTPTGGTIDLTAEQVEQEVVFRVRDSGIGISPEVLPRVFNVYFQGDPLEPSQAKGLGVGLSLVRQLTEMHGGTVAAQSAGPGKGSEFIVRLPIAAEPQDIREPLSSPGLDTAAESGPQRRILLADDDRDSTEAMALLLQAKGHEVRAVHNGPAALESAKEFKPDVAILDIGLPEMDGYELARQLAELVPGVTLIALSGWRIDPNNSRMREAGFRFHFTKPLAPDKLNSLLAELRPRFG